MVLDVESLPSFGKIFVEGVLEFEYQAKAESSDYFTFSLLCDHIIINGGRVIVGWEDEPFLGEAEIILRGDHFSPDFPVNSGPNVGGKAIGVFGGLDMHGQPREVAWTKLDTTIAVGDVVVTLEEAVDWVVGDEIVVAATSYNSSESERRTISAVAGDGMSVTVDAPFSFKHLGKV